MKKIATICVIITFFASSFAFGSDYLGTYCWLDNEGDVLELAVSDVGDPKTFLLNGTYYDWGEGLASPTTGNVVYIGGGILSGVVTTSDRSGNVMLDVVGHIELDLNTLNGSLWGVPKATDMSTGQQFTATEKLNLQYISCD